ncbi:hypothetical protein [Bradyrhizobium sp. BWA-3-5]|uniref:hypothetical protein n=1 Tax=Bradyrhizobium sp. BWA-3-5 TaxID=3080013 RepID=UPI00293EC74F|nr:hypothetical protein [Bradyrhizobium sp. BWA-3-5]WOH63798.1 hypothetical protein RX331_24235 [Bradyrhizobium sp. BWA-3-5]
MSFRFIEDHRDVSPVRLMCAVLEISPAGYQAWRWRPVRARTSANTRLLAAIRQFVRTVAGAMAARRSMPRCERRHGVSRGQVDPCMRRHGYPGQYGLAASGLHTDNLSHPRMCATHLIFTR